MIRVLLAEIDSDARSALLEALRDESEIEVCFETSSGREFLNYALCPEKYDIILMDHILNEMNGFEVLEHLQVEGIRKPIIMASPNYNSYLSSEANCLGVTQIITKPCEYTYLVRRLIKLGGSRIAVMGKPGPRPAALPDRLSIITGYLLDMGFPQNLLGYNQLRMVLDIFLSDRSVPGIRCKELYPPVAKHYGRDDECIERNIRKVIERAWAKGPEDAWERYCGISKRRGFSRPKNKEFISAITDYYLLHNTYIEAR